MAELQDVSDADFRTEVLEATEPVLVDFWAPWCAPCRSVGPVLEQIAMESGLRIVKINVDENHRTATRFRVASIPMMILFKQGVPAKKIIGALPKGEIESRLRTVLG